jgi:peptide/nickel transport system permease protein
MAQYLGARLAGAALTLFGVTALAFFATALAPGNPAAVLLGSTASPERLEAITRQLGLDQPIWVRYVYWINHVVSGDLGASILSHKPVAGLVGNALPVTLELSALSLFFAVLVGFPLGLVLALKRRAWWTRPAMSVITVGISVPGVWVGQLLILLFAMTLRLLPSGGYVPFTRDPLGNFMSMTLPVLTLSIYVMPAIVRFVRVTAQSVLSEDYVETARSKGISDTQLMVRHVAPNTLINTVTFIGLQLGVLLSGAIVTEVIFALPGLGRLGMSAVLNRDYPVIQGVVLVAATGYVLVNLAVDLAYGVIDPRVKTR